MEKRKKSSSEKAENSSRFPFPVYRPEMGNENGNEMETRMK
jgi:hypothetical protein